MKNYVDYKMTVWSRVYFKDSTDMNDIVDKIKENGINGAFEDPGFEETELLFETEVYLAPDENKEECTIEVYKDDDKIWTNTDKL